MQAPKNAFKRRLLGGETLFGLWMSLGSATAAEALSFTGYDWLLFDTEHAPVEVAGTLPLLQAAAAGPSAAVMRVAWNDRVLIKRALDIGAQTLLVPFVQTPEEAAEAVASCRYAPEGARGMAGAVRAARYGLARDYIATANAETGLLIQIETGPALARLEAIAGVEGVDGVFIGPADLSASMGYPGNHHHPEVQAALEGAAKRLIALGKAPGILATTPDEARHYLDWGYRFVALGLDLGLLLGAAQARLAEVRGA